MADIKTLDFALEPADKDRIAYLVGPEDENLKQICKRLGVKITYSGAHFQVSGMEGQAKKAIKLVKSLYVDTAPLKGTKKPSEVTLDMVHLAITEFSHVEADDHDYESDESKGSISSLYHKANSLKTKRGFVKARTANQSDYIAKINSHDVSFGIGPAGTGKTYLAVAAAVDALERNEVRRIILTRPAVEAGEKLGFLPGDLSQKVDPYLRPLYDALFEMLGFEKVEKLIERQIIEIAPLAYMRGRTLNDSFIILDEAQNTTIEQMKMFLTRIGFGSKVVITGDETQKDLPKGAVSGLDVALRVLRKVEDISICRLTSSDVVRHPLVQKIVQAYEEYEKKSQKKTVKNQNRKKTRAEK